MGRRGGDGRRGGGQPFDFVAWRALALDTNVQNVVDPTLAAVRCTAHRPSSRLFFSDGRAARDVPGGHLGHGGG